MKRASSCVWRLASSAFVRVGHFGAVILFTQTMIAEPAGDTSREVEPVDVQDQLTGAVDPLDEGFTRQGFLRAAGKEMELDREEFVESKKLLLEGKEERPWLRPFDAWPGLAKFDKKNEKGEVSNTIDWNEFHEYRHQVFHVLLKHHDKDKDGKLTGAERDEANRALAGNKLLKYLDAECCGEASEIVLDGRKIPLSKDPQERQKLIDRLKSRAGIEDFSPSIEKSKKLYAKRKELALQDVRVIEGEPETKFMPYTEAIPVERLREVLTPYFKQQLAGVMSEADWETYVRIIHRRLQWQLTGDPDGLNVSGEVLDQYSHGRINPNDALPDSFIERTWYSHAPVHRLGFASRALVAELRDPKDFLDEEVFSHLPESLRTKFSNEQRVLTVRMIARYTPSIFYSGASRFQRLEDVYGKIEMNLLYDPTNPHGHFFPVGRNSREPFEGGKDLMEYIQRDTDVDRSR